MWLSPESEIKLKSSAFDVAIVSCKESVEWHINAGAKRAVYCLPGFDPESHYPDDNPQFDVDVSICCTNFYTDDHVYPDQLSPTRMQIISKLAEYLRDESTDKSVFSSLAIYGPPSIQPLFPDFYKKNLSYEQTRDAFARSKLNLCTHVVGNREGYLSERVSLVLGSGGLLWVDKVPQDILTDECVAFIDEKGGTQHIYSGGRTGQKPYCAKCSNWNKNIAAHLL